MLLDVVSFAGRAPRRGSHHSAVLLENRCFLSPNLFIALEINDLALKENYSSIPLNVSLLYRHFQTLGPRGEESGRGIRITAEISSLGLQKGAALGAQQKQREEAGFHRTHLGVIYPVLIVSEYSLQHSLRKTQ